MHCICGNTLEERPYRVVVSPCRCTKPGAGRRAVLRESFLDDSEVSEKQYNERKRLGLPAVTEIEKSLFREIR